MSQKVSLEGVLWVMSFSNRFATPLAFVSSFPPFITINIFTRHAMKLFCFYVLFGFSSTKGFASSFAVSKSDSARHATFLASAAPTETIASKTCQEEEESTEKHDKKTPRLVRFTASRHHETPPLNMPKFPKTLDQFFSQQDYCDLLFSADATLTPLDNPSSELWDMLSHSATHYQEFPGMNDKPSNHKIRFVELANAPMSFIGVTLHSTATVGIQYLPKSRQFGLPEYHFYLLSTNLQARGPKPLVWLFYKLIGKRAGQEGISTVTASRFQTSGYTRVWAQPNNKKGVVFHNACRLESKLRIPSVLLSLMPFSVQHLEAKGSESLQTAIDKDMEPAAERFQDAYMNWISE